MSPDRRVVEEARWRHEFRRQVLDEAFTGGSSVVERRAENAGVAGPTPAPPTISRTTVNGALFFTELEGLIVQAHDRGLVNENALRVVLGELLAGQPLTLPMLMHVFGVDPVYRLIRREIGETFGQAANTLDAAHPKLAAVVRQMETSFKEAADGVPANDSNLPETSHEPELGTAPSHVSGLREPANEGDGKGVRGFGDPVCDLSAGQGDALR